MDFSLEKKPLSSVALEIIMLLIVMGSPGNMNQYLLITRIASTLLKHKHLYSKELVVSSSPFISFGLMLDTFERVHSNLRPAHNPFLV